MSGAEKPDLAAMFGAEPVRSFMGVPEARVDALEGARVAIFGAPGATPYASVGAYCAEAPGAIRAASAPLAPNREHVNFDTGRPALPGDLVRDLGDLPYDPADPAANRWHIAETVRRIRTAGAVPLMIGGDDSTMIPFIGALEAEDPLTVVQVDAHIDWRDEVGGERMGLSSVMRRAHEMSHVARLVQIGRRGIGSARADDLHDAQAAGVHFLSAAELEREGIEAAIALVPEGGNVVISFDADALDPSIMPAVIARTPGGLGYWDAVELVLAVCGRARLVGFGFVEFMPARDIDGLGATLAAQFLTTVAGAAALPPGRGEPGGD